MNRAQWLAHRDELPMQSDTRASELAGWLDRSASSNEIAAGLMSAGPLRFVSQHTNPVPDLNEPPNASPAFRWLSEPSPPN